MVPSPTPIMPISGLLRMVTSIVGSKRFRVMAAVKPAAPPPRMRIVRTHMFFILYGKKWGESIVSFCKQKEGLIFFVLFFSCRFPLHFLNIKNHRLRAMVQNPIQNPKYRYETKVFFSAVPRVASLGKSRSHARIHIERIARQPFSACAIH